MTIDGSRTTTDPHAPQPRWKHKRAVAIVVASALALSAAGVGLWLGLDEADASPAGAVQKSLDSLVKDGFPAALASVSDTNGKVTNLASGVNDIESKKAAELDGYVRIGSNTKTYTAVIVLQMVDEGLIELDTPIDTYLPGIVKGEGIDGKNITVRQLLQHTSGLPNYTKKIAEGLYELRDTYMSPRSLLDLALELPADFAPGEKWSYSNTGYIVLGLLIEKMSARPLAEQVNDRIVEKLDLKHTYFPQPGERELRSPHPQGYHRDAKDALVDITNADPSFGWAAGEIVAKPSDLNLFLRGILDGKLLSPESLLEMQKTVPADDLWEGAGYGLGLIKYPLSCGGEVWGHGGDIGGFETRNGASVDGRTASVAVTALPWAFGDLTDEAPIKERALAVNKVIDTAFCSTEG